VQLISQITLTHGNFLLIFLHSGCSVANTNPANYHYVNIHELSWCTAE